MNCFLLRHTHVMQELFIDLRGKGEDQIRRVIEPQSSKYFGTLAPLTRVI